MEFLGGLTAMGFAVAGLFFLRFWTRTRDRLFALFALAFWLLALNQGLLAALREAREEHTWIYLLRLAAFVLIIFAIVSKNRRAVEE
jgi:membrane-associated PAP2 superfamily phosphatase